MATTARVQRVADEIQKVIVALLAKKVRDPRLRWVSITGVDVSKDLSSAKVYFSSVDKDVQVNDLLKAFESAKGFFRSAVAKQINLRVAPSLRFIYDDSLAYGNKMADLIQKARKDDEKLITSEDADQEDQKQVISEQDDKNKKDKAALKVEEKRQKLR
ncbi:30S ribosome-binding factor RbfA [Facilibium subflavum]|uniref:30S ribosome-binding factor RbfA n=1 Tax=Facilibium subflavum TaxID=2219058 RepID=UPI000E64C7EF|nr:30S ribosome-binding factor RbfA [Facilibium subflavum]